MFFKSSAQLFLLCTCNFRGRHQTLYFILKSVFAFMVKLLQKKVFSLVSLDWGIVQLGDILVNHTAAVLYLVFEILCQNLSKSCRVWAAKVLQLAHLNSRWKSEQVYLGFGCLLMFSYWFCFLLYVIKKTGRIGAVKQVKSEAIALLQFCRAKCRMGNTSWHGSRGVEQDWEKNTTFTYFNNNLRLNSTHNDLTLRKGFLARKTCVLG